MDMTQRQKAFMVCCAEFKALLDDLGLTTTSGHYGFPITLTLQTKIALVCCSMYQSRQGIGISYITWPWIHPDYRNAKDFKRLATLLNTIGKQVAEAGLGFAYHNQL